MRVGYFGNTLFNKGDEKSMISYAYSLVNQCSDTGLKLLICSGGISYNYRDTEFFVSRLGEECKKENILFYFIVGNTDFYYHENETKANKEDKFREIQKRYRENEYYLPTHPIFTSGLRINGFESWYDYTLYRGKPRDLKEITRKSLWFKRNKDVDYITNSSDYTLGIDGSFDNRYTKETISNMSSRLQSYNQRWGHPNYNIAVMYFLPSNSFLEDSYFEKYFGTFKGSIRYMNILKENSVTDCIVGIRCKSDHPKMINKIKFFNPTTDIEEVVYYDNR